MWGTDEVPTGPQEDARAASAANQAARIEPNVAANTTIVGVGRNAGFKGVEPADQGRRQRHRPQPRLRGRPRLLPAVGPDRRRHRQLELRVRHRRRLRLHPRLGRPQHLHRRQPPRQPQPIYFGRLYQQHDGELDIVKGADYVTASWNVFTDHDKTILIGNSDSGRRRRRRASCEVTFHHNLFQDIVERAPRVRFGQVDAYNNHFVATDAADYAYSFGVGIESQLVAEHNAFTLPAGVSAGQGLIATGRAPR